MVRIAIITDTHYGFSNKTYKKLSKFFNSLHKEQPDIIVHSGDWGSHSHKHTEKCMKLLRKEFGNELPIIGTIGNHDCAIDDYWKNKHKTIDDMLENLDRLRNEYKILNEFIKDDVAIYAYNSWYRTSEPPSNDICWMPQYKQLDSIKEILTPKSIHSFFMQRNFEELYDLCSKIRNSNHKHKIVVTHFQPQCVAPYRGCCNDMCGCDDDFLQLLTSGVTNIIYGHTHMPLDIIIANIRIINVGSDYDEPKYKILTLETNQ